MGRQPTLGALGLGLAVAASPGALASEIRDVLDAHGAAFDVCRQMAAETEPERFGRIEMHVEVVDGRAVVRTSTTWQGSAASRCLRRRLEALAFPESAHGRSLSFGVLIPRPPCMLQDASTSTRAPPTTDTSTRAPAPRAVVRRVLDEQSLAFLDCRTRAQAAVPTRFGRMPARLDVEDGHGRLCVDAGWVDSVAADCLRRHLEELEFDDAADGAQLAFTFVIPEPAKSAPTPKEKDWSYDETARAFQPVALELGNLLLSLSGDGVHAGLGLSFIARLFGITWETIYWSPLVAGLGLGLSGDAGLAFGFATTELGVLRRPANHPSLSLRFGLGLGLGGAGTGDGDWFSDSVWTGGPLVLSPTARLEWQVSPSFFMGGSLRLVTGLPPGGDSSGGWGSIVLISMSLGWTHDL